MIKLPFVTFVPQTHIYTHTHIEIDKEMLIIISIKT